MVAQRDSDNQSNRARRAARDERSARRTYVNIAPRPPQQGHGQQQQGRSQQQQGFQTAPASTQGQRRLFDHRTVRWLLIQK